MDPHVAGSHGKPLPIRKAHAALVMVAACACANGDGMSQAPPDGSADAGDVRSDSGAANEADAMVSIAPRPSLPKATGTCPVFKAGVLAFAPGGQARTAQVWIDEQAAEEGDGPIVFYWHGTFSSPREAQAGLGEAGITAVTRRGGIVVAPVANNPGLFPWLTETDKTFALVDEIIACAEQQIGIDERHIHSAGMSAGGLFTSALSFARANLLASVAVYSGGSDEAFASQEGNRFAAMIFFGGASDNVFGKDFKMSSEAYAETLLARGHFVMLCDHGMGHNLPPGREAAVVPFFFAHPFGRPSPYVNAVPPGVPSYCR